MSTIVRDLPGQADRFLEFHDVVEELEQGSRYFVVKEVSEDGLFMHYEYLNEDYVYQRPFTDRVVVFLHLEEAQERASADDAVVKGFVFTTDPMPF